MAVIQHPAGVAAVLVASIVAILLFSRTSAGRSFFRFLPVPFYCYFVPILLGTFGILPSQSPVYKWFSQHVLPPCLILLLLGSPWRELIRLGRQAALAMIVGCVGMFAGSVAAYILLRENLPDGSWMASGALLGSWTGGSANMMAVKEALSMPESLLAPLIIVDTVIAYSWMALLIALAGFQPRINGWLHADLKGLDDVQRSMPSGAQESVSRLTKVLVLVLAIVVGESSVWFGRALAATNVFGWSAMTWTVILATGIGLLFSITPVRRLESAGASRTGTGLLLILLASYGAQTNLRAILESPVFMAFGVIMVGVHGILMVVGGRLLRIPVFYLATASQACIGGPVSTPIVSGVYQPALTHVGVVLALLGGAAGTYIGLMGAAVCRSFGG